MELFLLQENIRLFRQRLAEQHDARMQSTLCSLLTTAERQLALLESARNGTTAAPPVVGTGRPQQSLSKLASLRREFEASPSPYLIVDPRPGMHIVDINDAYAGVTMTMRSRIAGERLFDVFPDNPEDQAADGVNNLFASLRTATETGRPHTMKVQRYDVRDVSGRFVVKYWQPVNTPILDDRGNLMFLLHHVEDVTEAMLSLEPARKIVGAR